MQRLNSSRPTLDFAGGRSSPRSAVAWLLLGIFLLLSALPSVASAQPPNRAPARPPARTMNNRVVSGPHLQQWMANHSNMPLAQQERALTNEPGFHQLAPEEQRRQLDLLNRLSAMPPAQRQRYLAWTEAMERLSIPQRFQLRSATQQLGSLPEDRRRVVARVFRDVRSMPEPQRQQYLNSPQMRSQLNDQERVTLNNLILVSPYMPIAPVGPPAPPPPY